MSVRNVPSMAYSIAPTPRPPGNTDYAALIRSLDADSAKIYNSFSDAERDGVNVLFGWRQKYLGNPAASTSHAPQCVPAYQEAQPSDFVAPGIHRVPQGPPAIPAIQAMRVEHAQNHHMNPARATLPPYPVLNREHVKRVALSGQIPQAGPANGYQMAVLRYVYEHITPYPIDDWRVCIGVAVGRSYEQVSKWFNNQRNRGEGVDAHTLIELRIHRRNLRLREAAVWRYPDFDREWSVDGFRRKLATFIESLEL